MIQRIPGGFRAVCPLTCPTPQGGSKVNELGKLPSPQPQLTALLTLLLLRHFSPWAEPGQVRWAAQCEASEPEQAEKNCHMWADAGRCPGGMSRVRAQPEQVKKVSQQGEAQCAGSEPRWAEDGSSIGVATVGCWTACGLKRASMLGQPSTRC